MAWLDPYIAPRRTKTNVIRVDVNESEDDLAEDGEQNDGDENDSSISEKSDSVYLRKLSLEQLVVLNTLKKQGRGSHYLNIRRLFFSQHEVCAE